MVSEQSKTGLKRPKEIQLTHFSYPEPEEADRDKSNHHMSASTNLHLGQCQVGRTHACFPKPTGSTCLMVME
ncbi:hypothetical protein V6N12_028582 [Hibiscus sabdariffa]|uniref:Uncharacterized protein n=1 Tax=Hibiscus sabdariffa TaxID=183260 RepID=A0ABR2F693_9ROSI